MPLLLNYIHEAYICLCKKETVNIEPDSSYGISQQFLQEHSRSNLEYWKKQMDLLESHEDLTSLVKPELRSQIVLSKYKHILEPGEESISFEGNYLKKIKSLCSQYGFTVNALLQYCWHRQLSIYGASLTTVVGTVVSGRNLPVDGIEQSVGLYINTLPVILEHKELSAIELIRSVQDKINEVNSRSDVSLASLQKEGERLFNSLFVYENYPVPENNEIEEVLRIEIKDGIEKLDYPLGVTIVEQKEQIEVVIKYASELIDKETVLQLFKGIELTISAILDKPDILPQNIPMLSPDIFEKMVFDWNRFNDKCPLNTNIIRMFERQAAKTPNKKAIVCGDKSLTYSELNSIANKLGLYLKEQYDIHPDELIALYMDRSLEAIVSILGILKSGAAYVPISPDYPDGRVQYILSDTKAKTIITNRKYTDRIRLIDSDIHIEEIESNKWQDYAPGNFETKLLPENLAYIIYTSGTSGTPKGVQIEHRNTCSLISGMNYTVIDESDNMLGLSNLIFDASVYDIWGALLNGATLVLSHKEDFLDHDRMDEIIKEYQITNLFMTTALFNSMVDANLKNISCLKYILFGGEKASVPHVVKFKEKHKNTTLINLYGPTECTTYATFFDTGKSNDEDIKLVPIGKHINNTTTYILDRHLNPLPVGAVGELYLGGYGVSRGYLNQPGLTSERFISNPFQTGEEKQLGINSWIYKTGDLVRYLADGNIEYIGRNDFQIKIRGFRIELGEIESCLLKHPEIDNATVIARDNQKGTMHLVAYYVSSSKIEEQSLSEFLGVQIPEYMIPSFFIHMEKLPLTINGKIDNKSLPEPDILEKDDYKAPENERQSKLCRFFSDILNLNTTDISIDDDFFKIGGNSILVIKMMNLIRNEFHVNINIDAIYKNPSVRKLEKIILEKDSLSFIVNMGIENPSKDKIYMIHPSGSGCHVYNNFSKKISHVYNCYGVDNYNLYSNEKIDDISILSKLYLNSIINADNLFLEKPINLLGWSLGGQIALNMALQLEYQGYRNINVFLLDTILSNGNYDLESELRKEWIQQLENVDSNDDEIFRVETKMFLQKISSKLKYTKVTLFKASREDINNDTVKSILEESGDNNLYNVVNSKSMLEIIDVPDATHDDMVDSSIVIDYFNR